MGYLTVSWTSKHFHIQYMGKKKLAGIFCCIPSGQEMASNCKCLEEII